MEQCNVKEKPELTCANCKYYDWDIFEDSFGQYTDEYCAKGNYGHVGRYSETCRDFNDVLVKERT
jgi:hypothetical protein